MHFCHVKGTKKNGKDNNKQGEKEKSCRQQGSPSNKKEDMPKGNDNLGKTNDFLDMIHNFQMGDNEGYGHKTKCGHQK